MSAFLIVFFVTVVLVIPGLSVELHKWSLALGQHFILEELSNLLEECNSICGLDGLMPTSANLISVALLEIYLL